MSQFFYANDNYNSNLSAGFTVGETTMSVLTVPANVPTIICLGYGTDKEAVYSVTDKTSNSLTGVARISGYTGNLDAQMTVACLNNEGFVNQMAAVVSSPETLADNIYGADGGASDAYEISMDSPPSAYVAGMFVLFKANTANTGAATLNVNALGAKAIKKNYNSDLTDGDIIAGQVVGVVYDGTNFQLINVNTTDIVYTNTAQTITGQKTITKPILNGSVQAVTADSDGATVTFDLAASNVHTVTLGGNRTLAISNGSVGQYFAIELIQGTGGSKTVTWFSTIKWVGNTAPTLTTTANKKDTFMFRVTGTGTYDGYIVGMNI